MSTNDNIATARAYSNIAFIKYWGNSQPQLRLPANSSLSMNLGALHATTTVRWVDHAEQDSLMINGEVAGGAALRRVTAHMDAIRKRFGADFCARVESRNNFPMGAGIASSAAAFAALTLAAVAALGEKVAERELTTLARLGSGSAARSIPGGFVEWRRADTHEGSFAESVAPPEHWQLVDCVAILSRRHKRVGSTAGHATADSSIFQAARVATADVRLAQAKTALQARDFAKLAQVIEADSNLMHAVMMTSQPPLFYWQPLTLSLMQAVRDWREIDGLRVCYTLDAGPNVHCICEAGDAPEIAQRLQTLSPEIEVATSPVGGGAALLPDGGPSRPQRAIPVQG